MLDTVVYWHTFDPSLFASSNAQERSILSEMADKSQEVRKAQKLIDNIFQSLEAAPSKAAGRKISELDSFIARSEERLAFLKVDLEQIRFNSNILNFTRISTVRELAESDGEKRYEARAQLHQALSAIIEYIVFDPDHREVFVALKGHLMTFGITNAGEVVHVAFHNSGHTLLFTNAGLVETETPTTILKWQKEQPNDARPIINNMRGITLEQINAALTHVKY